MLRKQQRKLGTCVNNFGYYHNGYTLSKKSGSLLDIVLRNYRVLIRIMTFVFYRYIISIKRQNNAILSQTNSLYYEHQCNHNSGGTRTNPEKQVL